MSIKDGPHAELAPSVLADWVEQQGDRWWLVDDWVLSGIVHFPAPGEELAAGLRRVKRTLLVGRPGEEAVFLGVLHSPEELAPFIQKFRRHVPPNVWEERFLLLRWKDREDEWELTEDSATTEGWARILEQYAIEE